MSRFFVALLGLIATLLLGAAFLVFQARLTTTEPAAISSKSEAGPTLQTSAPATKSSLDLRLSTSLAVVPATRQPTVIARPAKPEQGLKLPLTSLQVSPQVLLSTVFLLLAGIIGGWLVWALRAPPATALIGDHESISQLGAQEAVIDTLRDELESARSETLQLRTAHDEQLEIANQLREENDAALVEAQRLREDLEEQARLAALQETETPVSEDAERIRYLEGVIERFSDQEERLQSWRSTLTTLQSEVQKKSSLIDELHDRLGEAAEERLKTSERLELLDAAESRVALLEQQNEQFADETSQLSEVIETLRKSGEEHKASLRNALTSVETLEAEKQMLADKVGELEEHSETARTATQALAELESELDVTRADAERYKTELSERHQRIGELEQLQEEKDQQLAKLEQSRAADQQALREELTSVQQAYADAQTELEQLRAELTSSGEKLAAHETQLRERDNAIAALNQQLEGEELRLREAAAERDAKIIDLEQERESLQQSLSAAEAAADSANTELETIRQGQDANTHDLQTRLSAKNAVVVELREELQNLRHAAAEAEQSAAEQIARLEQAQATLGSSDQDSELLEPLKEQIAELEAVASAKEESIHAMQAQLAERDAEIEGLRSELSEFVAAGPGATADAQQRIEEAAALKSELEDQIMINKAQQGELQRLAELEQLAAARAKKILELEGELNSRTDIIDTQQMDLLRLRRVEEETAPELEASVKELEGRLTQESIDNEALRAQLEERNRALSELAEQYAELRDGSESSQATAQQHVIQAELKDKSEALAELESKLQRRDQEISDLQGTLVEYKESREKYEPKLESQGKKLAQLENELDQARKNLRDLYQEIERLSEFERLAESRAEKLSELKADIDKTASHFGEMKKQVEDARKAKFEVREREARLSQLKSELMGRDQRIKALEEQIQGAGEIQNKLGAWESTVETYKNDLATKSRIIDKQREEIDQLRSLQAVIDDKDKSITTLVTALKHDSKNIEKLKRRVLRWKRRAAMLENKLRGTDPKIKRVLKSGEGEQASPADGVAVTVDKPTLQSADLAASSDDPDISGVNPALIDSESGSVPRPAGEAPVWLNNPPEGEPDDLTALTGVDQKLAGLLNDAGVFHYRQIARFGKRDLEWLNYVANPLPEALVSNKWISHAKVLHYKKYKRPA
ncbi:MAG: hypothetical protein HKN59_02885 [Gammaproteobacteria bacterium]|nr:hypothetical protein [Gammaproteobacteria bacterium]